MHTARGDCVTGIKRRHRDLSGDGVRKLMTALGRGRLKRGSRIIYVATASGLQTMIFLYILNQNYGFRCHSMEFGFEDPNQHLKDFLKLVDSLDLDGENRERTRLRLFQFSLRDQASNWLERLPTGSITTWEDLTIRFLAQFFPSGRTEKLCNNILMFQQHQGESLSSMDSFQGQLQFVPLMALS
ncbi:zinc finger, CCHC-type containing protein [Tanacetum coccineum]